MRRAGIIGVFLLAGCSLFQARQDASREPREIRDVGFQARKGFEGDLRKRVMVLPFLDTSTQRSPKVADQSRKAFVRALGVTDKFVIVNPTDFPRDVSSYILNGEYDMESMAKTAESLGLALLIEGKIMDVKAKRLGDEVGLFRKFKAQMDATVRLRVVATRNGREILNDVRSASVESTTTRVAETSFGDAFLQEDPQLIEEAITKAFRGSIAAIARTAEKLGWEGRVALVQGNRIYVNAGRLSGLNVGDILKVSGPGEEIYDPETGDLIGVAPGPMRGTLELVTYFGKDGAIAVVHSGSGFRENDLIELY